MKKFGQPTYRLASLFSSRNIIRGLIVSNTMKTNTENIIPKDTPQDLHFVWQKDQTAIKKDFNQKYAQVVEVTDTQKRLKALPFKTGEELTREETFNLYNIDEKNLFVIYEKLVKKAKASGVSIEYVDMTGFSEDDYHENEHSGDEEHQKHAETARSDGKTLLLEIDIVAAGGIQGRIYDLLHLAFGHMVQWSTEESNMLLTREEAWSIGYRNHEKSPSIVVDMMSFYEFEAGMQGVEALHQVLDEVSLSLEQKETILQYFTDYAYCDRSYIIQHYRGNHESFQKFWVFGQPIPPRQKIPHVQTFIERQAVEIGLIRDKQK